MRHPYQAGARGVWGELSENGFRVLNLDKAVYCREIYKNGGPESNEYYWMNGTAQ